MSNEFENGGSWLISKENYDLYVLGQDKIGRPDGQFVAPSNQINDLMDKYPNNPREWEKVLGLSENGLGDNPYRVDVFEPHKFGLREPTSDMSGANDKFIPGAGKTSGGIDEGVINPIPNPEMNPEIGRIQRIENYYKGTNTGQSEGLGRNVNLISSNNIASSTGGGSHAPPDFSKKTEYSKLDSAILLHPEKGNNQKYEAVPLGDLKPAEEKCSNYKGDSKGKDAVEIGSKLSGNGKDGMKM